MWVLNGYVVIFKLCRLVRMAVWMMYTCICTTLPTRTIVFVSHTKAEPKSLVQIDVYEYDVIGLWAQYKTMGISLKKKMKKEKYCYNN
jgi:hypothetical protein